ncbi:MAG TPA: hypothetical protein VL241_07520 [Gemmatimonadales bacterium]|nr:hypothetical protein [Gemmatimonadales bacterium]
MIARGRRRLLLVLGTVLVAAVLLLVPVHPPIELPRFPAAPGQDSVRVIAGERYRANALVRLLLGAHYRELWTLPINVEVLRLDAVDGGLRPVREGGGMETRSLHFSSAAGRHSVFRSLDKEITRLLSTGMSRSLLASVVQDQTSSAHPAGVLVAAELQRAAGLPAPHPRLVVLPDDPALGAFRPRFAGLLGILQESPGESPGVPRDSTGEPLAKHTDEVMGLLDAGTGQRIDAAGYLTARLLDFFLNDWDRHAGQWRWIPAPAAGGTWWRPVPIDRDQAFAWYDGILLALARLRTSKLSEFGPGYPHLQGLMRNSGALDRRLLAGLSRATWDSVGSFLTAALSDSVIDSAVHQMPAAYWQVSGPQLAATLKQRRAGLGAMATEFYRALARVVEVHAAATDTLARLTPGSDGSLELRLDSGFARRLEPGVTTRIELHLHRADGRIVVVGDPAGPIPLRVLDVTGREVQPLLAGKP